MPEPVGSEQITGEVVPTPDARKPHAALVKQGTRILFMFPSTRRGRARKGSGRRWPCSRNCAAPGARIPPRMRNVSEQRARGVSAQHGPAPAARPEGPQDRRRKSKGKAPSGRKGERSGKGPVAQGSTAASRREHMSPLLDRARVANSPCTGRRLPGGWPARNSSLPLHGANLPVGGLGMQWKNCLAARGCASAVAKR